MCCLLNSLSQASFIWNDIYVISNFINTWLTLNPNCSDINFDADFVIHHSLSSLYLHPKFVCGIVSSHILHTDRACLLTPQLSLISYIHNLYWVVGDCNTCQIRCCFIMWSSPFCYLMMCELYFLGGSKDIYLSTSLRNKIEKFTLWDKNILVMCPDLWN